MELEEGNPTIYERYILDILVFFKQSKKQKKKTDFSPCVLEELLLFFSLKLG